MPTSTALTALYTALAHELGCQPADFASQELRVVHRPPGSREPYPVLLVEAGTGSVISVTDATLIPAIQDLARSLPAHYRIFLPAFLESLVGLLRERGQPAAHSWTSTLGMVREEAVPLPPVPEGCTLEDLPPAALEELRAAGSFPNALLDPDDHQVLAGRFRRALALRGAPGELLAVTGTWDQYPDIDEIGIDVAPGYRGRGLGRWLTLAAAAQVSADGRWPIYTASMANIRSIRNGIACGFRPAWLITAIHTPVRA